VCVAPLIGTISKEKKEGEKKRGKKRKGKEKKRCANSA